MTLLSELKVALKARKESLMLTAAVAAGKATVDVAYDIGEIAKVRTKTESCMMPTSRITTYSKQILN